MENDTCHFPFMNTVNQAPQTVNQAPDPPVHKLGRPRFGAATGPPEFVNRRVGRLIDGLGGLIDGIHEWKMTCVVFHCKKYLRSRYSSDKIYLIESLVYK